MKIVLVKQNDGTFKLAYDSDIEKVQKIKANIPIEFEYKNPRNLAFHKKFFALINLLFQNQEIYTNPDDLRTDLTIAAGYYEERYNFDGEVILKPKSISFASMEEYDFNKYYNAVLDVIVSKFKFSKKDIEEHINQYF